MEVRVSKRGTALSVIFLFLAICFVNSPLSSSAEPSAVSSAPLSDVSSARTAQSDPLLDPDRVPEGVVIEYGPRFYWRDPTTAKVFWAQKTFLESLFTQSAKPQQPSTPVVNPPSPSETQFRSEGQHPSVASPKALTCRADLGDLNATELMKSAAQIESRVGVCGGARIASDLVMTNGHCVLGPNGSWAEAKSARDRESNMKARFIVGGKAHTVRCGKVMAISPFQKFKGGRDFAIVRCSGIPDDVPIMRVTQTEPPIHASIAIATWDWPRPGVPSRVSTGRVLGNDNSYLIAQLKIMDGNSGSMIVNANQEICGLANGVGEGPVAGKAFFHSMKEIMRQVKEQSPKTYAEITEATNASPPRCMASLPVHYAAERVPANQ
jgi:hypothetical protein